MASVVEGDALLKPSNTIRFAQNRGPLDAGSELDDGNAVVGIDVRGKDVADHSRWAEQLTKPE